MNLNNKKYNYLLIPISCLLYGTFASLILFKIPPIINLIIEQFNTEAIYVSQLMSAITLMGFLLAIPTGFLEKKLGTKTMVLIGAICGVTGCCLSAFSVFFENVSFEVFLISRCIEGICYIFSSICVPLLISKCVPSNKIGISTGIWALWFNFGYAASSLLTPTLYSNFGHTNTMLLYSFLIAISSIVMFIVLSRNSQKNNATNNVKDTPLTNDNKSDYKLKYIILWSISWFILSVLQIAVTNYVPILLEKNMAFDNITAALISSLPMIISIFSCLLFGYIADKQNTFKYIYTFGMAIMIPAIFLIFANPFNLMIFGIILAGIGLGAPAVTAVSVIELYMPKYHGIGMGISMSICCLGQTIGNFVVQLVLGNDFNNTIATSIMLLLISVIGFVCALLTKTKNTIKNRSM